MNDLDAFDRILTSLHRAMLDDAHWPAVSALIDDACGTAGNALLVGERTGNDVRVVFTAAHYRGQRREDLERDYLENYHAWDERVPRVRQLPDGRVTHVTELYTERELKTSRTYNEFSPRAHGRNSLNVRLPGPDGSHVTWVICDPLDPGGWASARIQTVERLMPHIRQFVRVRQALASASALDVSLSGLLDATRVGVIHLDHRGRLIEANTRALRLLRQGDGLFDRDGFLRARLSSNDARLQALIGRALLAFEGGPPRSGSMTVRRSPGLPRLVVHVAPLPAPELDFGALRAAALVLVVDPAGHPRVSAARVTQVLGLTPSEGRVAALLAEARPVSEIAAATGYQPGYVRWLLKQAYRKQNVSGQAALVRRVLTADSLPRR